MASKETGRGNNKLEYNTITEQGKELIDPEETKEHIAKYFENLCKAKPGTSEYEESTKNIITAIK